MPALLFEQRRYSIELLTPRQDAPDFEADLVLFRERFSKIRAHNGVVSIPDNPLGNLHFTAMEVLTYLDLAFQPEALLLHLNTFHRKADLDVFLNQAGAKGVRYLLCVSGDGGPRLPKLEPDDLGTPGTTVTSVELLNYIHAKFPGQFVCGVAFNQYEPTEHEQAKLARKLAAGAGFIITQPSMEPDGRVGDLARYGVPVFVGAWFSKRLDLLYRCLGVESKTMPADYDPVRNYRLLGEWYPEFGRYCSLVGFKRDWSGLFPGK